LPYNGAGGYLLVYYVLALFAGVLITALVASNGSLAGHYGIYLASVIMHVVGLTIMSATLLFRREFPFKRFAAWMLYMGGAIGVLTTLFNNFAFGQISISAILALGLLGQSITGLLVDQYGLMGMKKHPFELRKLLGLTLIIAGIIVMIDSFELIAVLVSLAAGACIVVSRTLGARLADKSSIYISTFYNYVVGLAVSVAALLILGQADLSAALTVSLNPLIYLGGFFGAGVVLICNLTVTKVSAFYLTLLMFAGQVFSAIIFDSVVAGSFVPLILIGGLLVSAGLCLDLVLDRKKRAEGS
jgi:transporter family-2 protein